MACLNSFLSASVRCGKILRSSCSRLCRPVLRNLAKLSLRTTFAPSPTHTQTHTHPFNGPLSGTTRVSRYQKGKTSLDFTEARESGSGISWAVCKPAPRSRQITMSAPHHSVFYRPDALPAAQPTASKH